jgi:ribosomal protein L37AE/L43A
MSEGKEVVARYNRTVPSLLKEAKIYRRKCNQCKGACKYEIVIEGEARCWACARCGGNGFRYSMSGKKQSPSFAKITVANMAKRSIEPYLNSLKSSVLDRAKGELEKEIDDMIKSFGWAVKTGGGK